MSTSKQQLQQMVVKAFQWAKPPKAARPCRLRMNGKFIVLLSGKSLWKTQAHAKSALTNHISEVLQLAGIPFGDNGTPVREHWCAMHDASKTLTAELLAEGVIELVEL